MLSRKRRASDAVAVAHERVRELTRTALHVAPSPSYLDRRVAPSERNAPLISERQREVVVKYVNEVRLIRRIYSPSTRGPPPIPRIGPDRARTPPTLISAVRAASPCALIIPPPFLARVVAARGGFRAVRADGHARVQLL